VVEDASDAVDEEDEEEGEEVKPIKNGGKIPKGQNKAVNIAKAHVTK
jgi:hypothetical protein